MSESGSSPMDVAVEMEVDLQEDVGAEFEDLILYSRLGLVDDATELVEEVLLRQIQHFPVFAEVTASLSERADMGRLEMVSDILASADAAFEDRDEALYCRIISLQRQGRLADQCQMALDGSEQSSLLWDLFNNTAYTSAVQILSLETSLQSLVPSSAASSQGTDPLILFIKRHFQTLITLRCHWEAARIFAILCHIYPVQSTDNADPKFISSMYQSIGEVVQDADLLSRLSADPDATMSTALTALSAKISFMLYIVRVYEQDVAVLSEWDDDGVIPIKFAPAPPSGHRATLGPGPALDLEVVEVGTGYVGKMTVRTDVSSLMLSRRLNEKF
ncbi:hypothetical protein OHC33_001572 [Knufia fluminis]|uniref:Uncharacterized protein n=1 Tax=Knufia fluminis TaxID=191047 RepID=A0AAN8IAV0_9EURO|nr:hypothetical protein OHC33_001572 [Knufia fluminis]